MIGSSITQTLTEFVEMVGRDSPTFQFWICLQIIQILLNFNRAELDYNWDLHLISRSRKLSLFFRLQ